MRFQLRLMREHLSWQRYSRVSSILPSSITNRSSKPMEGYQRSSIANSLPCAHRLSIASTAATRDQGTSASFASTVCWKSGPAPDASKAPVPASTSQTAESARDALCSAAPALAGDRPAVLPPARRKPAISSPPRVIRSRNFAIPKVWSSHAPCVPSTPISSSRP